MSVLIRSVAVALLTLTMAGCSPRVDRIDIYSGSSAAVPPAPLPPRAGDPVTVRVEVSPRQTTVQTPMISLQQLWAVAPITSTDVPGNASVSVSIAAGIPMTKVADGAASFAVTLPAGGPPSLSYGSTWLLRLTIPYRSWGRSRTLVERRQFTVHAPASCAALDEGIAGWSIPDDRISYGASLDDIHRWPQDTQTRFITRVALEPDRHVNYPELFEAADVVFGSARFRIGGDQPEKFREWLVRNPYINDKNHWIAQIKTTQLAPSSFSVQVKTDAEQPLRLRARAYCSTAGTDNSPCTPDHADSADVTLDPGPQWRTVRLPINTAGFPPGSAVGVGRLFILGEPADAEKRVWIDMACPTLPGTLRTTD